MTGWSVTVHDAEWLPDDRLAALEYQSEMGLICEGCGQPRDESMRPEVIDGRPNPDLIEYNALANICHACRAADTTASARAGRDDIDPNAGAKWRIEREATNGHVH